METILRRPATGVWLLLMVATGLSWWLGTDSEAWIEAHHRAATIVLMLIAFGKVQLIIDHFMEVRTAPAALRLILLAWVVLALGVILGLYLHPSPTT
jgi:hypothetical protein